MLRPRIIILSTIHISLQRQRPRHVIHLRHVVPVQLQRAEELVESQTQVSGDLGNADGRGVGVHTSCGRVTQDRSRTDNGSLQSSTASLADDVFTSPFALTVTSS